MDSTRFISLDGLDGTGKSTQCQLLAEWLRSQGIAVTTCRDPGDTPLGAKIRELLLFGREHAISIRTEALLFMASRAELCEQVIRPALARGEVVIADRYALANIAYQGYGSGEPIDTLWTIAGYCTNQLFPSLSIVYDLAVSVTRARRKATPDRLESRSTEYAERVRQGYLSEAAKRPDEIAILNADQTIEELEQQTRHLIRRRFPEWFRIA